MCHHAYALRYHCNDSVYIVSASEVRIATVAEIRIGRYGIQYRLTLPNYNSDYWWDEAEVFGSEEEARGEL